MDGVRVHCATYLADEQGSVGEKGVGEFTLTHELLDRLPIRQFSSSSSNSSTSRSSSNSAVMPG